MLDIPVFIPLDLSLPFYVRLNRYACVCVCTTELYNETDQFQHAGTSPASQPARPTAAAGLDLDWSGLPGLVWPWS